MSAQSGSFLIFNVASDRGAVVVPVSLPSDLQCIITAHNGRVFASQVPMGGNRVFGLAVASFANAPFQHSVEPQMCFFRDLDGQRVASGAYVWIPECPVRFETDRFELGQLANQPCGGRFMDALTVSYTHLRAHET